MSIWNHRILAHDDLINQNTYFMIHEVYYNKKGKLNGYTKNPITIGGENIESLHWTIDKIKELKSR